MWILPLPRVASISPPASSRRRYSISTVEGYSQRAVVFVFQQIYVLFLVASSQTHCCIKSISAIHEKLAQCKKLNNEPVFEEFIPLKKTCSEEKDDKVVESEEKDNSSRDK